jgi:hypothetical protein
MKKIVDGKYLDEESEDNEIKANSDMEGCLDIEDRLYEQHLLRDLILAKLSIVFN